MKRARLLAFAAAPAGSSSVPVGAPGQASDQSAVRPGAAAESIPTSEFEHKIRQNMAFLGMPTRPGS